MTREDKAKLIEDVAALLEAERQALLDGDLQKLEKLLSQKLELTDRLDGTEGADIDGLSQLKQKATRNQELLDNALKGIQAVADRMTELRRTRERLDTYDAMGKKQTIHASRQSIERRA